MLTENFQHNFGRLTQGLAGFKIDTDTLASSDPRSPASEEAISPMTNSRVQMAKSAASLLEEAPDDLIDEVDDLHSEDDDEAAEVCSPLSSRAASYEKCVRSRRNSEDSDGPSRNAGTFSARMDMYQADGTGERFILVRSRENSQAGQ